MAGFEPKSDGHVKLDTLVEEFSKAASGLVSEFKLTPPTLVGSTEKPIVCSLLSEIYSIYGIFRNI
jgi:hypothetical protein